MSLFEINVQQYLMLNVQFVVFPCLKRFVEASITLYCVIHKNGAPGGKKKTLLEH